MFGSRSFLRRQPMRVMLASLALTGMTVNGAPPSWWSSGDPPVWDQSLSNTPDVNKGLANVGQVKHMVQRALEAIEAFDEDTADEIRTKLMTPQPSAANPSQTNPAVLDLTIPAEKTPAWKAKQKAPLLIGQLKAIAKPFYDVLHARSPAWLENQLRKNHTKDLANISNYYPWSSSTTDDQNHAPASIGQVKSVFSLRFGNHENVDTDGDGLPDSWEIANGFDPLVNEATADSDNDGITNLTEYQNGTDPGSAGDSDDLDGDGLPNDEDSDPYDADDFYPWYSHVMIWVYGMGWQSTEPEISSDYQLDYVNWAGHVGGDDITEGAFTVQTLMGKLSEIDDDPGFPAPEELYDYYDGLHSLGFVAASSTFVDDTAMSRSEGNLSKSRVWVHLPPKPVGQTLYFFKEDSKWVDGVMESGTFSPLTVDVAAYKSISPFVDLEVEPVTGDPDKLNVAIQRILPVQFVVPAGDPVRHPVAAGNNPANIPDGANEFTFSDASSGVLTMKLKVRIFSASSMPASDRAKFKFELDPIGNSTVAWNGANPDGKAEINGDELTATATFTGLPASNEDFGLKKARLKFGSQLMGEADFEVFFPRDATNHPQGQAGSPNWFYYWQEGQVCGIPNDALYDGRDDPWFGYTLPGVDRIVRLCEAAPTENVDGALTLNSEMLVPGIDPPEQYGTIVVGGEGKGIQCVAETISHELYHLTVYDDLGAKVDADHDGVADSSEGNLNGIRSSPLHPDTYGISLLGGPFTDYGASGDDEVRGRKEETNITFPVLPRRDWANPGCQSYDQHGPKP